MTQFDGELSPPFTIVEPASWRAPIIFNSPHSGSVYPAEFLNASRIDLAALRRSEDSFMDELIGHLSERGFPVVTVNFPRSYVDVNREPYELDPRMFTGRLPSAHGAHRRGSRPDTGLRPSADTLAARLHQAGFATAGISRSLKKFQSVSCSVFASRPARIDSAVRVSPWLNGSSASATAAAV